MNKKTLSEIISCLPFICILAIVAMLPFRYSDWQRVALYAMAVAYPLDYIVNRRWQQWHWDSRKALFAAFILFSLMTPLWQLIDPLKTGLYQETVNAFAPFFFVGIAGILGMTDKIRMDYVAWVMLSMSAGIVCFLMVETGWQITDMQQWAQRFTENRIAFVNSHMVFNLYLNIAIVLGVMVLFETKHHWGVKTLTSFLMLPSVFALLITEGRTGMLTLFISFFLLIAYYVVRSRHWWLLAVLALFSVSSSAFLLHNDRIHEITQTTNPRIYQWRECIGMITDRPLIGYGVCSARKEYVSRVLANEELRHLYIEPEVQQIPEFRQDGEIKYEMMHPHNAMLESWTRYGLLGVVLCMGCLLGPMCMRLGKYQIYLTLCALAFLIQAMFESFGNNLQPLFLVSVTLLFYGAHLAEVTPSAPAHP